MALNLSGINLQSATYANKLNQLVDNANSKTSSTDTNSSTAAQDKVTLGGGVDANALTYSNPTASNANSNASASASDSSDSAKGVDLASMLADSNDKVAQFTEMLSKILQQQGLTASKVVSGEQQISADPQTIAAAKQAVSEDGEFGVKNTATRILSFAKAAIAADPSKLDQIKDAIQSGFDQAAQYFGGKLPDISNQTHDAIMATLDSWSKNGIPSGDVQVVMPNSDSSDGSNGTDSANQTADASSSATTLYSTTSFSYTQTTIKTSA